MQVTYEIRDDWKPLLDAAATIIPLVMGAGEEQRIKDGLPTDSWKNPDLTRYFKHAFLHLVSCQQHEKALGHQFVLAANTSIYEQWHAVMDLLIIAAAVLAKEPSAGLVIETLDEE